MKDGNIIANTNQRLQRIARRAERVSETVLEETFVGIAGIENILHNPENQIITGRRGTGKTHALKFLQGKAIAQGSIGIYIDLRLLGSESSIYNSSDTPKQERITKLTIDFFSSIHDALYESATNPDSPFNIGQIGPDLDELAHALTRIFVEQSREELSKGSQEDERSKATNRGINIKPTSVDGSAKHEQLLKTKSTSATEIKRAGHQRYVIHFSTVSHAFRSILSSASKRVWLFVDEWSSIPEDLQPYLADALRRILFPLADVTVIIAAIEHRSQFQLDAGAGYLGMEVGADCATSINLDDFMVFENNPSRARHFFSNMLYRHVKSVDDKGLSPLRSDDPNRFIKDTFTQKTFDELIRAAEGVPRDAINIASIAARRSVDAKISMKDVRFAAGQWFQQDKAHFLRQKKEEDVLLAWIVDNVLGEKRARAFLVEAGARHQLLDSLYDGRVIHVVKRSVSAHDRPGKRYIVYKIDYGCYVDLLATARAPQGFLPGIIDENGTEGYVEVPPDDYRSIRRSILDINAFNADQMLRKIKQVVQENDSTTVYTLSYKLLRSLNLRRDDAD